MKSRRHHPCSLPDAVDGNLRTAAGRRSEAVLGTGDRLRRRELGPGGCSSRGSRPLSANQKIRDVKGPLDRIREIEDQCEALQKAPSEIKPRLGGGKGPSRSASRKSCLPL